MTTATVAASRFRLPGPLWLWGALSVLVSVAVARLISGNNDLTSPSMFGVALRGAAPIAMAGLAGLYSERSGTINIGLEGMMILGTAFAGWWGWEHGPWMAVIGGMVGGMLGGVVMGIATVTFKINHIVAGFALNILAPGIGRFMSTLFFVGQSGGGLTNSPGVSGDMGEFTMPLLSGGSLVGWHTPDPLQWISDQHWFVISDLAGLAKALTTEVSFAILLSIGLFVVTGFLLWRTSFGLRLRSAGERPSAADSLGVNVTLYRYIGLLMSGSLAGLGGTLLVLNTGRYNQGMVSGRGFLGLATLVVGNWRPFGVGVGAALFGFFDGVTKRLSPDELVVALLLAAVLLMSIGLVYGLLTGSRWAEQLAVAVVAGGGTVAVVAAFGELLDSSLVAFFGVLVAGLAITIGGIQLARRFDVVGVAVIAIGIAAGAYVYFRVEVPDEFVDATPYLVTLIVVSTRGQALRPPAEAGEPWDKSRAT